MVECVGGREYGNACKVLAIMSMLRFSLFHSCRSSVLRGLRENAVLRVPGNGRHGSFGFAQRSKRIHKICPTAFRTREGAFMRKNEKLSGLSNFAVIGARTVSHVPLSIQSPSVIYNHSGIYRKNAVSSQTEKIMFNSGHAYSLQSRRTYIFFERGFRDFLEIYLPLNTASSKKGSNKNKDKGNQIVITLRDRRRQMMKSLRTQTEKHHQSTKIKLNQWKVRKQHRVQSLIKHRSKQFRHNTNDFVQNFRAKSKEARKKTYDRFQIVSEKAKSRMSLSDTSGFMHDETTNAWKRLVRNTKRRRERIRGSITSRLSQYNYRRFPVTIDEPFRKEWFTKDGFPLTSRDPATNRFVNPWNSESTNGFKNFAEVWRWKKTRLMGFFDNLNAPKIDALSDTHSHPAFVGSKTREELKEDALKSVVDEVKLTWIGHATNLIHVSDQFRILTDPMFSNKASPIQMFQESEFFGVPRWMPPSLSVDDIGDIDICMISHDHYDHLDLGSVEELHQKDLVKFWVVPLGMKEWLIDNIGIEKDCIVELEWWQSVKFLKDTAANNGFSALTKEGVFSSCVLEYADSEKEILGIEHSEQKSELVLTCAPAQHWCSRSPFDRNTRLWCSWAVHSKLKQSQSKCHNGENQSLNGSKPTKLSFYFAGDTGYPESFPLHRQIGDRLGPFDLAAIPIGAYKPRFFMQDSHCDPNEAVKIHQDIRSKKSVAIHWGTFPLANEPFEEPPNLLKKAVVEMNGKNEEQRDIDYSDNEFIAIPHGESIHSTHKSRAVEQIQELEPGEEMYFY